MAREENSDDDEGTDEFESEEIEVGDQFMACKPWLGAIKKPEIEPLEENKERPDVTYKIEFVHGYKSDLTRQNLFYNNDLKPVYMTAALGIILDHMDRT
jgi:WD40 repeat protein